MRYVFVFLLLAGCSWGEVKQGTRDFSAYLAQPENKQKLTDFLKDPYSPVNWVETLLFVTGGISAAFGGKVVGRKVATRLNNKGNQRGPSAPA